jgi:hypothetical protein
MMQERLIYCTVKMISNTLHSAKSEFYTYTAHAKILVCQVLHTCTIDLYNLQRHYFALHCKQITSGGARKHGACKGVIICYKKITT